MKNLGFLFIVMGICLMVFVIYLFFKEEDRIKSPIPDKEGIKVIFITPAKK